MDGVEILRDRYGTRIGEVRITGSRQTLLDRYGYRLSEYDAHLDLTRDKYGTVIGHGNLLVTLLPP
jgi:hypothetical protein